MIGRSRNTGVVGRAAAIVQMRGIVVEFDPTRSPSASFGRSLSCDLVVGASEDGQVEDAGVSRRAGTIRFDDGATTVVNDSTSRVFAVRPDIGPERTVGVGEALTLSIARFSIVLHGQIYAHTLTVDVGDPVVGHAAAPVTNDGSLPTTRVAISDRERRYCAALCEPLLVRDAPRTVSATYRQAGARLGLKPATIREQIDDLRHRLITDGFHGLDGGDGRDALMRFLVESGTINVADLRFLP